MKEVCGFKDTANRFWNTREEAEASDRRLEEEEMKDKVTYLLMEAFRWNYYSHGYLTDVRMGDLVDKMFAEPDKFLTVFWEVTKYNFKKKMNEV